MKKILLGILVAGELLLGWGFYSVKQSPSFGAAIPIPVAFFQTSLQGSISSTDSTMTLVSGNTPDGSALSGFYGFVIDEGSSTQEVVTCSASSTALTACTRGISSITGNTSITALKFAHRRGATVKITTSPIVLVAARLLNGNENLPNKLKYDGHPDFSGTTASTSLIDRYYADNLVIAGAPNASTVARGIAQEATVAQTNSGAGTGSTGARLFVSPSDIASSSWYGFIPTTGQSSALVGNNTSIAVGTGNKYVTQTGLQNRTETYVTSGGSANAYTLTLSPVPTALVAGQMFDFKANFTNTASTSTINVNGLGAINIKRTDGSTSISENDIQNGGIARIVYDGTNFQMTDLAPVYATGSLTSPVRFRADTELSATSTVTEPAFSLLIPGNITIDYASKVSVADGTNTSTLAVSGGFTTGNPSYVQSLGSSATSYASQSYTFFAPPGRYAFTVTNSNSRTVFVKNFRVHFTTKPINSFIIN